MLTDVLNAPISKLTVGEEIDLCKNFLDSGPLKGVTCQHYQSISMAARKVRYFFVLDAVFEDVLDNETSGFAQSHLMPHAMESVVNLGHDLRRFTAPAKFEELLPHMAGITVDDSLRNTTKQFVDHDSLMFFGNTVERLLDNVAAKGVHAETERITTDSICNRNDLLGCTMLEAALN